MNLVERAKAIILSPNSEWPVIDREPDSVRDVLVNYVAILAAIPAICRFIGTAFVGFSALGVTYRVPVGSALTSAIIGYILTFVGVYVLAFITNALAPRFKGTQNMTSAVKLAAYAATPAWLVGVFSLIPALSFLGILGLYSLYLFYAGVPVMMKSPSEKSLGYTITIILLAIVIAIVIGFLRVALIGIPNYG